MVLSYKKYIFFSKDFVSYGKQIRALTYENFGQLGLARLGLRTNLPAARYDVCVCVFVCVCLCVCVCLDVGACKGRGY
jgi:hypothetical protein